MITNPETGTRIDEIASGIYRISTPVPPEAIPGGFTFNQFLIKDEAPLLYLDNQQINFQMPFEAMGQSAVDVVVNNNGAASSRQTVQILSTSPGIFVFGNNRALATNQDGSLNATDNPSPRREVITVYMTGQGLTAPEWQTGKAGSTFPLVRAPSPTRVLIGGVEAKINFLGLAPGLVGVLQLNVEPACRTPTGDQDMVVNIGGYDSNVTKVTIR